MGLSYHHLTMPTYVDRIYAFPLMKPGLRENRKQAVLKSRRLQYPNSHEFHQDANTHALMGRGV